MSERDIVSSPKPSQEPSTQPSGMSRIRYLRKIASWNPPQYKAILEAYAKAPQISGETLVNAKAYTGDDAETVPVDILLPKGWTRSTGPIERGDEYLLVRPEIEEAIQVSPIKNPQALQTFSTYTPNSVDNPYLQQPAADYDRSA